MFQMDLKARFKNKAFLIALVSAILLLLKNFGLGQYIPENIDSIVNGFITIGILLGVITDTSTPGISDKTITPNGKGVSLTVDGLSVSDGLSQKIETILNDKGLITTGSLKVTSQDGTSQFVVNDSSVNSSVQANNSASAKIVVDNPENVIEDGKEVNLVTATSPTV